MGGGNLIFAFFFTPGKPPFTDRRLKVSFNFNEMSLEQRPDLRWQRPQVAIFSNFPAAISCELLEGSKAHQLPRDIGVRRNCAKRNIYVNCYSTSYFWSLGNSWILFAFMTNAPLVLLHHHNFSSKPQFGFPLKLIEIRNVWANNIGAL